jgi:hypothetical protein
MKKRAAIEQDRARRFAEAVPKAPTRNLKRLAAHACCQALLQVTKNKGRQLRLV